MKICYIANARIPSSKAHGVQIMKMCEAFAALGHEVVLVVPDRRITITEDPFTYYGVRPVFTVKKVWTIDTVPFGWAGYWFQHLLFSVVALGYIAGEKFDLVYSRDELSLLLASFFTRRFVREIHVGRYNWITAFLLRGSSKIVVISQGLKDFYTARGVASGRILVAHDAIDLEEFAVATSKEEARTRLNLPHDAHIAMYIGALKEWKGHETLLRAAKHLAGIACVAIIGNTEKQTPALLVEYPDAFFVGIRPYRELPHNQRAADVLVIPNLATNDPYERFTSPLKVFAHMASGVPIVASDVPALREVLSGETALFFKPGDPKDLAQKIEDTLKDPAAAARRAQRARKEVENYTWHKRAVEILQFVQ